MKNQKLRNLSLDSLTVLSKEQQSKIKGGGYWQCYGYPNQGCPAVSATAVPGCDCRYLNF